MIRIFAIFLIFTSAFAQEKFVMGTSPSEGLFSSFLAVISGLIWAKKNQKIPVVYWTQDSCYAESGGYNGSLNPWEYYFKPVSSLSYEKGDRVHTSLIAPDGLSLYQAFSSQRENFYMNLRFIAKEAIDRYIQVQPSILEKVRLFYEEKMAGKTTIGIHLRGTDRAGGKRDDKALSERKEKSILRGRKLAELVIEAAAKEANESVGDIQFFIATDDESLLELAKGILTRPIVTHDSHRSKDGTPVHRSAAKEGRAIVGEEVLIEALLLSKCNFLAHSFSSVAIAVLLFNPDLKNAYLNLPVERVDRTRERWPRKPV
jgi:hypothetical protein